MGMVIFKGATAIEAAIPSQHACFTVRFLTASPNDHDQPKPSNTNQQSGLTNMIIPRAINITALCPNTLDICSRP